ncbi:hypothetical protein EB796_005435 [Bugula neritina]|uniref:Uncharacterized protein n=1 Tax=Bugula neritina TaxID=10212 RepID=A0A7J7KEI8_BUGNE|nr:hypothetical protein EB796_005435 [Bugula neritina]
MEYIMWIKIIFISGLLASHCLFVEPAPTLRAANLRKSMDMAEKTSSRKLSRAKRFSFNLSTRIDICPFVFECVVDETCTTDPRYGPGYTCVYFDCAGFKCVQR